MSWREGSKKGLTRSSVKRSILEMVFMSWCRQSSPEHTLGWLRQWACSRSFGLGTRLPWDPQYLIESLSDSTIYMAYYTVAHLLQGGGTNLNGQQPGPLGLKAEDFNDGVWEYIFKKGAYPAESKISEDILKRLR